MECFSNVTERRVVEMLVDAVDFIVRVCLGGWFWWLVEVGG